MKKRTSPALPQELMAEHFPEHLDEGAPSSSSFKAKVLELHEAGRREESAELLKWKHVFEEQESRFTKASKITMFSLAVVAGALGVLWFIFGGFSPSSGSSILVCSVGGQIMEGDRCLEQGTSTSKNDDKKEEEEKTEDILVGSF